MKADRITDRAYVEAGGMSLAEYVRKHGNDECVYPWDKKEPEA